MSFSIRKALPEDAYEYAACHIETWQSAYRGIIPDEYLANMSTQLEQRAERFKEEMTEQTARFYLSIYQEKVIGKLVIGQSRDEDKPNAGEIIGIYLLEGFWGKGYGRKMLDFALKELKMTGYSEALIWVLEGNHRARRFYEKCGFIFDGAKKEMTVGKPLPVMRYVLHNE
ncbi:MAG: GNAT family N-acetyltransferase [Oscillospiraceae bacterium]|nr:GNAT family N-acetyltransferase [Oscillospiraceae bacterium]